jgi:hypothetical protein
MLYTEKPPGFPDRVGAALAAKLDELVTRQSERCALETAGFPARTICQLMRLVDIGRVPLGVLFWSARLARAAKERRISRGAIIKLARYVEPALPPAMMLAYKNQRLKLHGLEADYLDVEHLDAVLIGAALVLESVHSFAE